MKGRGRDEFTEGRSDDFTVAGVLVASALKANDGKGDAIHCGVERSRSLFKGVFGLAVEEVLDRDVGK